ncbi:MAG: hypothetical protein R3E79_15390 [Caldilineaceae bacterium]
MIKEALQSGKPVGVECHGSSLAPFARVPGTAGQGFDGYYATLPSCDAWPAIREASTPVSPCYYHTDSATITRIS